MYNIYLYIYMWYDIDTNIDSSSLTMFAHHADASVKPTDAVIFLYVHRESSTFRPAPIGEVAPQRYKHRNLTHKKLGFIVDLW